MAYPSCFSFKHVRVSVFVSCCFSVGLVGVACKKLTGKKAFALISTVFKLLHRDIFQIAEPQTMTACFRILSTLDHHI